MLISISEFSRGNLFFHFLGVYLENRVNKIGFKPKNFNPCQTGSTADVTTPKRYNPNFHIFLQWSRDKCGLEFLNAIEDGSIRFDAMDQYDGIDFGK